MTDQKAKSDRVVEHFPKGFCLILSLACIASISFPEKATAMQNMEAVRACRSIEDVSSRLACFDRASAPALASSAQITTAPDPSTTTLAPASPVAQPINPEVAPDTQFAPVIRSKRAAVAEPEGASVTKSVSSADDSFGAETLKKNRDKKPRLLVNRAVSFEKNRLGKLTITLENGQVWKQLSSDTNKLYLPKKSKDGVDITIKKGAGGAHYLRAGKSKRPILVRRIK